MAIGSYDATPLDMAGAYTVFSNGGVHIDPWMLASVRTSTGDIIEDFLNEAVPDWAIETATPSPVMAG